MISIDTITSSLSLVLSNLYFMLSVELISFSLKTFVLSALIHYRIKHRAKFSFSILFLSIALASTLITNFSWCIRFLQLLGLFNVPIVILIIKRLAWIFSIFYYPCLILFIGSLIDPSYYRYLSKKILIALTCCSATVFLYVSIFRIDLYYQLIQYVLQYSYFFMVIGLLDILYLFYTKPMPRIVRRQVKIIILAIILPQLFFDLLQIYSFLFHEILTTNYSMISISSFFSTLFIVYCTRKVISLRFLNIKPYVQSEVSLNFMETFKDILEQLSHTSKIHELAHITKTFFNNAFLIKPIKTVLVIRHLMTAKKKEFIPIEFEDLNSYEITPEVHETIESFINNEHHRTLLQELKVLMYDDIEFNQFHDEQESYQSIIKFLNAIQADLFIPIYQRTSIVAYIVVKRHARKQKLYNSIERDQIIIFANYLSNVINFLQNRNVTSLIKKEKEINEELYYKHQEINQYKESLRVILKNSQQRRMCILFYKNRKFVFANVEGTSIIPESINTQEGHPIAKTLKKLINQVQDSRTIQKLFSTDIAGDKIVLTGIPTTEHHNIVIIVHYPEISDILKDQITLLKDPTTFDYLLYLETTQSGKLINQLMPGSGETILNFKIDLLKIALNRKAILLNMQDEDLQSVAEIIHHISLKEVLHTLHLKSPEKNVETAIKLFGINPIFGSVQQESLLQKLDGIGTLFIQNIHFLSLESQHYLAEFIRYGFFHIFKGDQIITADVRIICSTNQDLQLLVQEGRFSKELYNELAQTSLKMPSLLTIPEKEFDNLVESFAQQAIKTDTFKAILEFNERDKRKILEQRPASLQEFKAKVQQILITKSKKSNIYQETQFDPAYNITDPTLMEAARLGKHALKEAKIMAYLWNKFKSQNKIAAFLGVNRSSVNRRCKEYEIM